MYGPDKILDLLNRESPLSPTQISKKLNMKSSTVTSILSFLKHYRFVQYHQGFRGQYELTESARDFIKKVEEEMR